MVDGLARPVLSMSARTLLFKHVLTSIPIHLLTVLVPPRGVVAELERMFARFFWGESEFRLKRHWTVVAVVPPCGGRRGRLPVFTSDY